MESESATTTKTLLIRWFLAVIFTTCAIFCFVLAVISLTMVSIGGSLVGLLLSIIFLAQPISVIYRGRKNLVKGRLKYLFLEDPQEIRAANEEEFKRQTGLQEVTPERYEAWKRMKYEAQFTTGLTPIPQVIKGIIVVVAIMLLLASLQFFMPVWVYIWSIRFFIGAGIALTLVVYSLGYIFGQGFKSGTSE